jgi:hypothetical protein
MISKMPEQNTDKQDATPCVRDVKFTPKTLKQVPHVAGLDRPLRGMNKTSAKRPQPKQKEPDDAA